MQDGYTQVGAGDSDMRVAGQDLQHNRQPRTADEHPRAIRIVHQPSEAGGPMKQYLDQEMQRHNESKQMRMQHIEQHYKR